jgi:hypothetical protein
VNTLLAAVCPHCQFHLYTTSPTTRLQITAGCPACLEPATLDYQPTQD